MPEAVVQVRPVVAQVAAEPGQAGVDQRVVAALPR